MLSWPTCRTAEPPGDFFMERTSWCWLEESFTKFYEIILLMLNDFYPLKTITLSNRDPYFVTPYLKSLLRKRNKLMKRNKIEAANALASKIGKFIARSNAETFAWPPKSSETRSKWYLVQGGRNTAALIPPFLLICLTPTMPACPGYDVKLIRCCPEYDVKLIWRQQRMIFCE